MRFRTHISDVRLLNKIIRSLSALAKTCVIRLTPDTAHFIVPGNEGKDGVQVWSHVKVDRLFTDFRIESNNNNEIWLEINLEGLLKVLRSCEASVGQDQGQQRNYTALATPDIMLKLIKKGQQAMWSFELSGETRNHRSMKITHEIHVHILTARRQDELKEPMCPPPNVHIVAPNLGDLRNIVSRLGHLSDHVRISANLEGRMEFTVETTFANLTTTWTGLHNPQQSSSEAPDTQATQRSSDHMFSCTASVKALLRFLNSHLIGNVSIISICDVHCIIAYVYIGEMHEAEGVLTFFVPHKTIDNDD